MADAHLDIPGPRSAEGGESPALQVIVHEVTHLVTVVEVRGDLDTMTAREFDGWMRDRLDGRADVVLDLDGVLFLASAGIAVLQILGLEEVLDLQASARSVVAELAPSA